MAGAYKLAPSARVEIDVYLAWLEGHGTAAAMRFVGALENASETLASGVADGRLVVFADRRRAQR